jgi:hypothetical protein
VIEQGAEMLGWSLDDVLQKTLDAMRDCEARVASEMEKIYQSELQESGFLYQDTIDANYPQRDFHTMYVGKIEKVLVRDNEYLK